MVEKKRILVRIMHPLMVLLVYLFLYLPIVLLAIFSFNASQFPVEWTGFSLKWYKALWYNPEVLEAAKNSFIVATASTILSVLFGTGFVFASKWWRNAGWFNLFYANILLPDIVLAIGEQTHALDNFHSLAQTSHRGKRLFAFHPLQQNFLKQRPYWMDLHCTHQEL